MPGKAAMDALSQPEVLLSAEPFGALLGTIALGGAVMWPLAVLSVIGLAVVFWKAARFALGGVWGGARGASGAVTLWQTGARTVALAQAAALGGARARFAAATMAEAARAGPAAEAEAGRIARAILAEARAGLRFLDFVATAAPLLGLLGTVLGMIDAFRALEAAGARTDPAILAGGMWEALLTTAAGMAVALPAAAALSLFEGAIERLRHDMEDLATRILGASGGP
jgi:biopolymer transport protein ExbB